MIVSENQTIIYRVSLIELKKINSTKTDYVRLMLRDEFQNRVALLQVAY